MAYAAQKLALQYDCHVHFHAERARQDRGVDRYFISRGWAVLRYYDEDARGDFRRTVREVTRRLNSFEVSDA